MRVVLSPGGVRTRFPPVVMLALVLLHGYLRVHVRNLARFFVVVAVVSWFSPVLEVEVNFSAEVMLLPSCYLVIY